MQGLVENPPWLRAILYLAVFAFALLAAFFAYLSVTAYFEAGLITTALLLPLTISMVYISYIGVRLFPFISAKLSYSENGFVIENRGHKKNHHWHDVGRIEKRDFCDVLIVRGRQDETLYIVDYATPGYKPFLTALEGRTNDD